MKLIPIILCGGSGSRLWPLSRETYPKQLLKLTNQYSLLQNTILRCQQIASCQAPMVICNEDHRFLVAQQLQEIDVKAAAIILEPMGKNTAPATALAAFLSTLGNDSLLLVLPADHLIGEVENFQSAVNAAIAFAIQDNLITFGIKPTYPETGYGYIQIGEKLNDLAFKAAKFVEKPEIKTAEKYLQSGDYFWNSGMFLFSKQNYLTALKQFAPKIFEQCQIACENSTRDLDFTRIDAKAFSACPADSIDYAIMEKANNVVVIPTQAHWCDLGSFASLKAIGKTDAFGNVISGQVKIENVKNSFLHAENRLLAAVGIEDHIVVETADAVLVTKIDACQDVKKIVQKLKQQGHATPITHRKVFRPWGSYETLEITEHFQVKRIIVNPKQRLSLQMHHHRAEHWVVVKGQAEVTRDDATFTLHTNESTYIPVQTKHRLENKTAEPIELIEVQCGSYLGEDDIVRFKDDYGRSQTTPENI